MKQYDAIIIGTGQAGVPLALSLNKQGWKTAIIEKGPPGGTCVNTGCMPTKNYVASAQRANDVKTSGELGISSGKLSVDLKKIWERKEKFIAESRENIQGALEDAKHIDYHEGHARFVDDHTIEVNGEQLTAEKIFINVGARAFVPDTFAGHDFMTNVELLEMTEVPDHLIVIGGSYIGLEFGQIFRRYGARVTIIERKDRIISKEDGVISTTLQEALEAEGIEFRLGAECLSGKREKSGKVVVNLDCEEEDKTISGSHLLLAVGRQPNTDDLGLEKTSIAVDTNGHIEVDDWLRTNVEGIYALGDCNGKGSFTHTAYNDFQIVENKLFGDGGRTLNHRILAYGLYTEPALGRVGKTEAEARKDAANKDSLTGEVAVFSKEMSSISRARIMNKTAGTMRVIVDTKNDEILGAAFLGIYGDELINGIADMMYAGAPYSTIRDAMHIHPTVAEFLPTLLESEE